MKNTRAGTLKAEFLFLFLDTNCKGEFDGLICWPHGDTESLVNATCPEFISPHQGRLKLYGAIMPNKWF